MSVCVIDDDAPGSSIADREVLSPPVTRARGWPSHSLNVLKIVVVYLDSGEPEAGKTVVVVWVQLADEVSHLSHDDQHARAAGSICSDVDDEKDGSREWLGWMGSVVVRASVRPKPALKGRPSRRRMKCTVNLIAA